MHQTSIPTYGFLKTTEWSVDMAAFTTDLVSDVARACDVRTPLMVSAFHTAAIA